MFDQFSGGIMFRRPCLGIEANPQGAYHPYRMGGWFLGNHWIQIGMISRPKVEWSKLRPWLTYANIIYHPYLLCGYMLGVSFKMIFSIYLVISHVGLYTVTNKTACVKLRALYCNFWGTDVRTFFWDTPYEGNLLFLMQKEPFVDVPVRPVCMTFPWNTVS